MEVQFEGRQLQHFSTSHASSPLNLNYDALKLHQG